MTYKDVYDIAMPVAKRQEEKFNIWVTLAVRPLSVLVTVPFTKTKVKPITITAWSLLSIIAGFFLVSFGMSFPLKVVGWLFFFAWAVLDGVDGNLARCTNQCSNLGDLWDTTGGYASMVLIYYSASIASFYDINRFSIIDNSWLLILGGATAIFSIFPRLVLQKKKTYDINSEAVNELSNKKKFGITQVFAMNLVSPSGFMQVVFLICICFKTLNLFVIFYFFVNLGIMMISLKKLLFE